jgi:hypothetical protein
LQQTVTDWQKNALKALKANDWRAQVSGYREVWVDARLSPERQ